MKTDKILTKQLVVPNPKIAKPYLDLEGNKLSRIDTAWLKLGDISKIPRSNPLISRTAWDIEHPGMHELRTMMRPEYLSFACKVLLNIDLLPFQSLVLEELWNRPFPMFVGSRGVGKSYLLAVYALLKCILVPETKVVIAGAAFRQSKIIFEYMEGVWRNADILRDICSNKSGPRHDIDRHYFRINDSLATAIPIGTGEKIRGLRANTVLVDEFGSVDPHIFEVVIAGFGAVSASPVENVQESARRLLSKELGTWSDELERGFLAKSGNQAIISGTASYGFQHFATYWKRYKAIIESRGNPDKLKDIFEDGVPEEFSHRDYSVIRIPYEMIPKGFMDDKTVIRSKATVHSGVYEREYGAVFSEDSAGFFKSSLVDSCVANSNHIGESFWPPWCPDTFDPVRKGNMNRRYVFGVDPASEQDNFSIVILELWTEHVRVVHVWSTNRKDFKSRHKAGLTKDHDFYGFCARKIRDLMKVFPCVHIALDKQGGGVAVEEALQDPDKLEQGEVPILPVIDDDKPEDSDILPGDHILELCQFVRADWTAEANHGLRKDMEDKALLFPRFDNVTLGLSVEDDKRRQETFNRLYPNTKFSLYDSLEDCIMEIEELKDELASIVLTRTGAGSQSRDRWDTPEVKLEGGKKGRLRKDRYSSLVMANMAARKMQRTIPDVEYDVIGDFSYNMPTEKEARLGGKMYNGPSWFAEGMQAFLR